MRTLLPLALLAVATGCQSASNLGEAIPSVGAEIVLRDVTVKIDEASVRLLLTPAELQSLAQSIDPQGG